MFVKPLEITEILVEDKQAKAIADKYVQWEMFRANKVAEWREIHSYVFATDTSKTSNSKLPWSNKTTLPKLCQIRDNLHANYMASLFPRKQWMIWEGQSEQDEAKRKVIQDYMRYVTDRNDFYETVSQLVYDYIDYGNPFATSDFVDLRDSSSLDSHGFVGPVAKRISPLDIVFDPTAVTFELSPKIIRTMITLGELKDYLSRVTITEEDRESFSELVSYMENIRSTVSGHNGTQTCRDSTYNISGFGSYSDYLNSEAVEVLTYYGDIYDEDKNEYLRNQIVRIVDRHKVLSIEPNSTSSGTSNIFHVGWRSIPDNLWAMGPLDNLVGMQYRIDHLENMKSDIVDLTAYPVLKIRGYVDDFDWQPMERILVGDDGDVTMLAPDSQALQLDTQINLLEQKMEEMAGSPKEAMGFRTPGEKTAYEVQRLENAASRIFQSKVTLFERQILEPLLNAMLDLARRNINETTIRLFDDELKIADFISVTKEDISGRGRLIPVAARHFAEKASIVQNINSFFNSSVGSDQEVKAHFSSIGVARLFEQLLGIEDYNVVEPYIRLTEQADAQRLVNANQESVMMEAQTPTGLTPEDSDASII